MSTQRSQNEDELAPIEQAENSQAAKLHDEIHWIMAKFPLGETKANVITILELIAVALPLHSLKGIILFLNNARSDKIHPIEKTIRYFSDLSKWYSGSALIQNTTNTGGGIEKATRIVVIHKEMEPITAITTTFEVHPSLLDEHENSNKENPRNREPGCIYTIEYANSESSSLFFYNPSRETVVYCQSRLHYCYKATVRKSNE
jgi:hypothetical protein